MPLDFDEFGWYRGIVCAEATDIQKSRFPGVTHEVKYFNRDTNNVLPARDGVYGQRGAKYTLKLDRDNWGRENQWVVLKPGEPAGG